MTSSAHRRLSVLFQGRVQGVGFRFTMASVARGFDVAGYVKNLPDEDVEMVVEGTEEAVNAFLDAARASHVYRFVVKEHLSWSPGTGEFKEFGVAY